MARFVSECMQFRETKPDLSRHFEDYHVDLFSSDGGGWAVHSYMFTMVRSFMFKVEPLSPICMLSWPGGLGGIVIFVDMRNINISIYGMSYVWICGYVLAFLAL